MDCQGIVSTGKRAGERCTRLASRYRLGIPYCALHDPFPKMQKEQGGQFYIGGRVYSLLDITNIVEQHRAEHPTKHPPTSGG